MGGNPTPPGRLFVRLGAVGELLVLHAKQTDRFGPLGKSEKRVDSNERGGLVNKYI